MWNKRQPPKTCSHRHKFDSHAMCGRGGIGRRAGLKNPFLRKCRFDSGRPHHTHSLFILSGKSTIVRARRERSFDPKYQSLEAAFEASFVLVCSRTSLGNRKIRWYMHKKSQCCGAFQPGPSPIRRWFIRGNPFGVPAQRVLAPWRADCPKAAHH